MTQSTAPGSVSISLGGVARNVAEAAHRLLFRSPETASRTMLVAPVGNDAFASIISDQTKALSMRVDGFVKIADGTQRTPSCNMLLDSSGDLFGGVADFEALKHTSAEDVSSLIRIRAHCFNEESLPRLSRSSPWRIRPS